MAIDKVGKVQVLATLGAGAHSSILHVRRDADGREYALKVVSIEGEEEKKYLEQARHEFKVAQKLDHPNLVKVYTMETETDWLFRIKKAKLLIEFVDGETLDRVQLLKMAKVLRVFEKVASGLVHMHKQGVIHADLKPNNIMLGRGGVVVKIIDYGLAWIKGEPSKDRVQGTPEYMAPETATHKVINERTDIYNFGATLYRTVTFRLPPSAVPSELGFDKKAFKDSLQPVNELNPLAPPELCDLIHRCLSYDAHKRPARMSEVQGVLDRLADEAAAKADPSELEG